MTTIGDLPCLIEEMDFPTYLSDPSPVPSLTSSLVRELLSTAPRAVWQRNRRLNPHAEVEHKTTFDIGTAAHAGFVGQGEPIVVIPFDSYRKAEPKKMRDDAYAAGKTPVLEKDMERVNAMVDEAVDFFGNDSATGPILARKGLLREASMFWIDRASHNRSRPDFFDDGASTSSYPAIIHYKTTAVTIHPQGLGRFAANQKWDMIAAHYQSGVFALTGKSPRQYFAIQETEPPHLCIVAELSEHFVATAQMRRERALYLWGRCLRENNWPGHIDGGVQVALPPWHENTLIEAKDIEQAYKDKDADLLDLARRWQAPFTRTKED